MSDIIVRSDEKTLVGRIESAPVLVGRMEQPPVIVGKIILMGKDGTDGKDGTIFTNYYTHVQMMALAVWPIKHDLGKYPAVTVIDSSNRVVVGDIVYIDDNNVELHFSAEFAGIAYLN